ncbi:pyridoxamine 5'-phosphate oxidase family protein [Cytobacillus gottheilii]|uniref:pyridoxamine 5'-phosphate oxidase family protein n=1 Tax=Cytobacillus gottheilii TaxID=859144 RepID=UPI0009BAE9A4|nr:pyridoxamine 5'-phosphate oxidase family protein [Cytobacillus gottheilii]
MANRVETQLIEPLYGEMQKERFVTLATVDYETGGPNVHTLSWVLAKDKKTVLFAVESHSRIIQNIENNNQVIIYMIANESAYSIAGVTTIKEEVHEDLPLKLALVSLRIEEVRDVMFYGSKITIQPQFDKTYDREAASRLDEQVMNAIKKA